MKSLNGIAGIWSDPDIHGGQPLVEDLRIPVYLILDMVAQRFSPEQMSDEYGVEERHVQLAAHYASVYLKATYIPVEGTLDTANPIRP
jgi:uncharacterized protein (DUF433 family)